MIDKNKCKIHFIGVGGVGMSGIALLAKHQGYDVSGSDIRKSYLTDVLCSAGIDVKIGHDTSNINKDNLPDMIVVSTAILENNVEYQAAKKFDVKILHRAQMLAFLGKDLKTLAVSGTHGKTSTSSMLAYALDEIGQNPTFLIGGVLNKYNSNEKYGDGEYYVVEADESDKSFKYLNPFSCIITNIEADHLDHYSSLTEIYEKFADFIASVDKNGFTVVCGDDKKLLEIANKSHKNIITYGFSEKNDAVISSYKSVGVGCSFKISFSSKQKLFNCFDANVSCTLNYNPGKHYALNAAGVLALLNVLNSNISDACKALKNFQGVKRRFELIGKESNITVVDDYAHHSTEIAATVKAACAMDFNNVHVIWQPHRYSRIGLFRDVYSKEFAQAFDGCSTVSFTDVYAAGETPIPGVTGKTFLDIVKNNKSENKPKTYYIEHRIDIVDHVLKIAQPGDLIITMGAGDITSKGPQILAAIKEKYKN